jgi:hypothetical protein
MVVDMDTIRQVQMWNEMGGLTAAGMMRRPVYYYDWILRSLSSRLSRSSAAHNTCNKDRPPCRLLLKLDDHRLLQLLLLLLLLLLTWQIKSCWAEL